MSKPDYMKLGKKVWDLYALPSQRCLEQTSKSYKVHPYSINARAIRSHLEGNRTVGIFLDDTGLTKFFCFDVDIKDKPEEARYVTLKLIWCLIEDYNISPNHIHVSLSGDKGYHVELFFDEALSYKDLKPFYLDVLDKIGETKKRVEPRPTNIGVKLPLGKHRKTPRKKRCWFVDTFTLKPIRRFSHVLTIEPMKLDDFKSSVLDEIDEKPKKPLFTLTHKQAEATGRVVSELDLKAKSVTEVEKDILEVLDKNRLLYSGTRHNMTLQIAKYCYYYGDEPEEARDKITSVMMNTWTNYRDFISADTTKQHMLNEIDRIVSDVYEKGYKLVGGRSEVEITKGEILQILECKNLEQKKLLFSMLVHSKRFAKMNGEFYMSYSTMTRMGNTANRTRLLMYIHKLQNENKARIVSKAVKDVAKSKTEGTFYFKTNQYAVTLEDARNEEEKASITLKADYDIDLFEVVPLLITENEAKKILPKSQYYNTGLKEAYKKVENI